MNFIALLWSELVKTFLKKRTYLGFLIALIIIPIVELAMQAEGDRVIRMATRNLANDFFLFGNMFNGWFVSRQVMMALWLHVPLLITFVAGDMLAGEATAGTYRLILTRSVSRTRIFLAKLLATYIYVVMFVAFLGILSVGLAVVLMGTGDLMVVQHGILVLPADDVAWRFAVAFLIACVPMLTVASIALLMSSFVENAIGPIVATMGVIIVFSILTFLPVQALDAVRGYLFMSHMTVWQNLFEDPVPWSEITSSFLNLGAYMLVCAVGAWAVFLRKDVLS